MAAPIPIPPQIESITAPLLLGSMFNYGLYGVLCVQVYLYNMAFPEDLKRIKTLVYAVFFIETLQVAMNTADTYYWFASGYGDILRLDNPYLSPFDTPIMCAIVSFIVQTWFCYRIWVMDRTLWWWSGLLWLVSAAQAIAGFVGGVKGHIAGRFSEAHQFIRVVYVWLIGCAIADILIAASMAYLLLKARDNSQQRTSRILIKLVTLIIETNTLTASIALLSLILFLAAPDHNWFTCPTVFLGKLYSNTLLVSFNNRHFLRVGKNTSTSDGSFQRNFVAHRPVLSHSRNDSLTAVESGRDQPYNIRSFGTGANEIKLKNMSKFSSEERSKRSDIV